MLGGSEEAAKDSPGAWLDWSPQGWGSDFPAAAPPSKEMPREGVCRLSSQAPGPPSFLVGGGGLRSLRPWGTEGL